MPNRPSVFSIEYEGGQKKHGVAKGGAYISSKLGLSTVNVRPKSVSRFWSAMEQIHSKLKSNQPPRRQIYIGGDHSCAIATVSRTIEQYGSANTFLIWIDAHADINIPKKYVI